MKTLIIWGTGAHAGNLWATLQRLPELPFAELLCISDLPEAPARWWGLRALGNRRVLDSLDPSTYAVFPAVGLPHLRQCMHQYLQQRGFEIPTIVDPAAVIEPGVQLGAGCLIRAQCCVGYDARLAEGVLLNTGAQVSHESDVGAYTSRPLVRGPWGG